MKLHPKNKKAQSSLGLYPKASKFALSSYPLEAPILPTPSETSTDTSTTPPS